MRRILGCLLLISAFYACTNGGHTKSTADTGSTKPAGTVMADTVIHADFKQFWNSFRSAVKKKDTEAINQLTHFPIHNLHPCYLPTGGKTRLTDTAGLSMKDFTQLSKKVFDDETSWLTNTTADSLYVYSEKDDDKKLPLMNLVDHKTPVYIYAVVYNQERTGGTKSLYFGSIKGSYKLIWIDCDGNVTGH